MDDMESWVNLSRIIWPVWMVLSILLYLGCGAAFLIKFRAALASALLGAAGFVLMIVPGLVHLALSFAAPELSFKVGMFIHVFHILGLGLLLVAIVLAPTRPRAA